MRLSLEELFVMDYKMSLFHLDKCILLGYLYNKFNIHINLIESLGIEESHDLR